MRTNNSELRKAPYSLLPDSWIPATLVGMGPTSFTILTRSKQMVNQSRKTTVRTDKNCHQISGILPKEW